MNATGLFFMRMAPYSASTPAGERSAILPLIERIGDKGTRNLTAIWRGEEAGKFIDSHTDTLRPGAALNLTLTDVRCVGTELHADIVICTPAPARWTDKFKANNPDALVQRSGSASQ